jgi:rod shape-determining protein MreD
MIGDVIKYTVIFILLVLAQGLILNNIEMGGYINPYLYVLLILLLPFEMPGWAGLLIAFVLGISVDVFTSTLGIHTSATLFMAFARKYVLKLIEPRGGYEFGTAPEIQYMGFSWFLTYAGILVLLHHIFLFFVESFTFSQFFSTLGRTLLSTIFTIILILITQLFSYKPGKRK